MSRSVRYEKFGPEILGPLNDELDGMVRRLDSLENKKIKNIYAVIGTTETEIRHDMRRKPEMVIPVPRALAIICQTRPANETSIYLVANVQVKADVYLR